MGDVVIDGKKIPLSVDRPIPDKNLVEIVRERLKVYFDTFKGYDVEIDLIPLDENDRQMLDFKDIVEPAKTSEEMRAFKEFYFLWLSRKDCKRECVTLNTYAPSAAGSLVNKLKMVLRVGGVDHSGLYIEEFGKDVRTGMIMREHL